MFRYAFWTSFPAILHRFDFKLVPQRDASMWQSRCPSLVVGTIRRVSPCNLAQTRHFAFGCRGYQQSLTACKHPADGDGDSRVPHLATYRYARATRVRLQRWRDDCPPTHAQRRHTIALARPDKCSSWLPSAISFPMSRDTWAILFRHPQPRIQPQALIPSSAEHPPHHFWRWAHLPPASQFRLPSVLMPVSQGFRLMAYNRRWLLQPFEAGDGIYRCGPFVDKRPKNIIK